MVVADGLVPEQRLKRPKYLAGSEAVFGPDENMAALRQAHEAGELPTWLFRGFEAVERSMQVISEALTPTQALGAPGYLAIRWWKISGAKALPPRTPVLVRHEAKGRRLVPHRVTRRDMVPRSDGAFELNADLVADVLSAYWDLYRQHVRCVRTWAAYRRWASGAKRALGPGWERLPVAESVAEARRSVALARLRDAGYPAGGWWREDTGDG